MLHCGSGRDGGSALPGATGRSNVSTGQVDPYYYRLSHAVSPLASLDQGRGLVYLLLNILIIRDLLFIDSPSSRGASQFCPTLYGFKMLIILLQW